MKGCWKCEHIRSDYGNGYCIKYDCFAPSFDCEKGTIMEVIETLKRIQEPAPWEPAITNRTYNALEYVIKILEEKNEKISNP